MAPLIEELKRIHVLFAIWQFAMHFFTLHRIMADPSHCDLEASSPDGVAMKFTPASLCTHL